MRNRESNPITRFYAWIILRNKKRILCSYDKVTKQAFFIDEYGSPTLVEIFNFTFDRYATSEELKS